MYLPPHFRERRTEVLHEFIERHPLGMLVTSVNGAPVADHVPMLLVRDQGANGTLQGHVARANPLWRTTADGAEVLVVFHGADAYVSPSSYPSKHVDGKVVPTWNYAVVHAHGRIRFFEDEARLHALVSKLTDHFERPRSKPWSVADAPEDYVRAMVRAIVGFEIEITDLAGKFKASQNRSAEDRAGVRGGMGAAGVGELDELVRDPDWP
jgi:transcriptional regulator